VRLISIIFLTAIAAVTLSSCEKTEPDNASITTMAVNTITAASAISGGIISADAKLPVLSRGICWSKNENPTLADSYSADSVGAGSFESNITGINAAFTYYVRAYYINSNDTVYGNQLNFITPDYILFNPNLEYGTVTDIDGNVYKTITIGTQTWMAENLKTTSYQNGDMIPNDTDLNNWGSFQITTGAYCWYNNDVANKNIHGALYNWYVASDSRNIAPVGWHVSSVDDWQTLMHNFNGNYGNYLRERTTAHWYTATLGIFATNSTGFTALPGGKVATPPFGFMDIGGDWAYFWTSNGSRDGSSCVYLSSEILIDNLQPNCRGFNIRCVKD